MALTPLRINFSTVLLIFLISVGSFACKTENQTDTSGENNQGMLQDSSDLTGPPLVDDEPDCSPEDTYLICNRGLAFAPLGLQIAELHAVGLEELGLSEDDSLDYEMEYVRLNRSFSFDGGFILLEGKAISENGATDELLSASTLSRIRIESPLFHTLDGVSPGMSIEALQAIYPDEEIFVSSFGSIPQFANNPRYEFLMLNPQRHPHITYLLPDPSHRFYQKNKDKGDLQLSMLPKSEQISSIVVSE